MTLLSAADAPATTQLRGREALLKGMRRMDISGNKRIATIMELVGALSRAQDPREVLRVFSQGMVKLNGPRGYVSLSTRGLKPGEYRITRLLSNEGDDTIDAADPWSTAHSIPIHTGGFFGELIRSAYPEVVHDLHLENDPVVGDALAHYRSMMAVPIFDNGEPLNWSVILLPEPDAFRLEGLEETIVRVNLVGGTVRKVLMTQELRQANERIRKEVEQIARIQRTLLPDTMPTITGVKLAASYETFEQAGGDYYDFLPLRSMPGGEPDPDGPWAIFIADASGHGPAAAVVMAMLHSILHAYPSLPEGPGDMLRHINEHLCAKRIEGSFATAFLAIYDPPTRRLTYARAGHNPPLLKSEGEGQPVVRLDDVGEIPLGVMRGVRYEEATRVLNVGETLVLYTDGITEAMCPQGDMFGIEGLETSLTACTGEPDCVIKSTAASLLAHEGGVRPTDDQTLVAMKIVPVQA